MKVTKEQNLKSNKENLQNVGAPAHRCLNKGITLIALIITIIVMLILVAVTISMAINGGLFEKAGQAVGDTQDAINKEQKLANGRVKIGNVWYDSIDDYLNNNPSADQGSGTSGENGGGTGETLPTYENANKDVISGILKENATYTSGEYTAVVPKGFKIVEGLNGSTSIADGLVIQDANGNEFVWIPVTYTVEEGSEKDENGLYPEFLEVFYRSAWDGNQRTSTLTETSVPKYFYSWSDYTEPYESGYTTPTTEIADYYEMMRSVQKNKGFYIGRYEAGSQDASGNPIARTDTANGTSKVVVKRDQYPYIYVGWGLEMSNYTTDVTDTNSKNQGKGALYLSKHMYDGQDIGATSTLCYGIQWDAMLDFIKEDKNVTSSNDWGNYKDNLWKITRTTAKYATVNTSTYLLEDWEPILAGGKEKTEASRILLTTGANEDWAAKNIYDVAGNVFEWTNEAKSSSVRVYRGSSCLYGGVYDPAADRSNSGTNACSSTIGFRPSLYIKEQ